MISPSRYKKYYIYITLQRMRIMDIWYGLETNVQFGILSELQRKMFAYVGRRLHSLFVELVLNSFISHSLASRIQTGRST